ncbi:MAG: DUF4290 domain-containing protein [Amoebophilaceae bacterium]|jgi:hypothetical protein|nr:DUF4290 domain-containing protein [Amoebophilaceae bacterium]
MHDYNATRKPLILREYGRNVQNLAEVMRTMEDRAQRTLHAQGVLRLMAILDANNKYSAENAQKRWDDLMIISEYTLDVDGPYPMPEKSILNKNLQRPAYTKQPIKFRSYGRNVERLIQKAVCTEDPKEQEKMVVGIVKLMKNFSNEWNRDNVDCNTLLVNIKHMADNKLAVDFEKLKARNIFHTTHKDRNRGSKTNRSTDNRKKTA